MKIILILFLSLFTVTKVFSADIKYPINIRIHNELGDVRDNIIIGVGDSATENLDSDYGEFELFKMFPPETLFGCCEFYNAPTKETIWSYYDIRELFTDSAAFTHVYKIVISRGFALQLKLSWGLLDPKIESAWITDVITENILRINMKDSLEADINNEFLNEFFIHVKYRLKTDNVVDEIPDKGRVEVYPNPADYYLNIQNTGYNNTKIEIYDLLGRKYKSIETKGNETSLNVSDLISGQYYCRIYLSNGEIINRLFVKY